jgi:WD40 repeat protein
VWDVQSGVALRNIRPGAREVNSVSWSPDGAELAIGTDAAMVIVEAETGSIRLNNEARTGGALSVAWSPDGGRMAYGGADASVRIVDAASGALLREFSGLDGPVTDIAWSPDGGRLAAAAGRYARSWSVGP